jgi:hypothetical protein
MPKRSESSKNASTKRKKATSPLIPDNDETDDSEKVKLDTDPEDEGEEDNSDEECRPQKKKPRKVKKQPASVKPPSSQLRQRTPNIVWTQAMDEKLFEGSVALTNSGLMCDGGFKSSDLEGLAATIRLIPGCTDVLNAGHVKTRHMKVATILAGNSPISRIFCSFDANTMLSAISRMHLGSHGVTRTVQRVWTTR